MPESELKKGQFPGDLTPASEETPKQLDEIKQMDLNIAKTFSSAAGKKTLKWLRDQTIELPTWQISDGLSGVMTGFAREGQNALIRLIEQRMRRAKQ